MESGLHVHSRTYVEPESLKMVILLTKIPSKTLGCQNIAPKFSRSLLFGLRVGIACSIPNQPLIPAETPLGVPIQTEHPLSPFDSEETAEAYSTKVRSVARNSF
jgi:hypothetical protein